MSRKYGGVGRDCGSCSASFRRTLSLAMLAMMLGCASGSNPADPAAAEARIVESKAEFRELAARTIGDPGKAQTFISLLNERDRLMEQHAEMVKYYAEKMRVLNTDYDTTREQFEQVMFAHSTDRRMATNHFVALMSRMKAATTEKEWKKLTKFELKELNPRTMAYASEAP